MRRVRYAVGMSLDGFIADLQDGVDWMTSDPAYDSRPFFAAIDTMLVGRRSYEVMVAHGVRSYPGLHTVVFSRTMTPADHPDVTVLDDAAGLEYVRAMRDGSGKDVWLSGGGELATSLWDAGLVDTIELGISPVVIGRGRPFLPGPASAQPLRLTHQQAFPSGLLVVHYDVVR